LNLIDASTTLECKPDWWMRHVMRIGNCIQGECFAQFNVYCRVMGNLANTHCASISIVGVQTMLTMRSGPVEGPFGRT
jgi:hypothetical protein